MHGVVGHAIRDVARATLVSQLQYGNPAWSGILSAAECSRQQTLINKAVRYGFLQTYSPFQSADQSLFQSVIRNPNHVLRYNYSHLLKTQAIPYDLNHTNTYCQPNSPTSQQNAKLTFIEYDNIVFLYFC